MARFVYSPEEITTVADELRLLAEKIDGNVVTMKKKKIGELEINHEGKRRAALNNLEDWIDDMCKQIRLIVRDPKVM